MKKITQEELEVFLRKHKMWLDNEEGGERAVLYNYDLRGSNLYGSDLRFSVLCCSDLRGSNLCGSDLRDSDLRGSDLRDSYLCGSDLRDSDLRGSDLRGVDLRDSDLRDSDLCGVDLFDSDLRGVDLREAKNIFLPIACPEEGEFIGFKKANDYIVKLKITDDAKRCSATGRKCRCSKAVVLSITNRDGSESGRTEVASDYNSDFVYRVGETVEEPKFCEDRWSECSEGIHFFITRKEAEDY